jgi:hypothetical protein
MPRRVPGALCLGLLAAFLAHIAVYGGSHAMGGTYAETLRLLAITTTLAAGTAWLATGWAGHGRLCNGTVIVARMARLLPSTPSVAIAAVGWFSLAESIEGSHGDASIIVLAGALLFASLVVGKVAKIGLRVVAEIVFGMRWRSFIPRLPSWTPIDLCPAFVQQDAIKRHYFARPPPIDLRS